MSFDLGAILNAHTDQPGAVAQPFAVKSDGRGKHVFETLARKGDEGSRFVLYTLATSGVLGEMLDPQPTHFETALQGFETGQLWWVCTSLRYAGHVDSEQEFRAALSWRGGIFPQLTFRRLSITQHNAVVSSIDESYLREIVF